MSAYYNEHDKFAAEWLRILIREGHIADGEVDERDIQQVAPGDLKGFIQCHFFAGIGGWSFALRLSEWPDNRPVWTGSCPCQPFSIAGKVRGVKDERHLWPVWFRLIRELRPSVIFGEQIASSAGYQWLAGVHAQMEAEAYSFGAVDLCAASVKAKHPRQRLWFVADSSREGLARPVAYRESIRSSQGQTSAKHRDSGISAGICFEPDPDSIVRVDGLPRPVGRVRSFGNAIVPQVAAEFIEAYMEISQQSQEVAG